MDTPANISSSTDRERDQARKHAEELERDLTAYPEDREEILLEAAGQWAAAGEDERALEIFNDLIVTGSEENAQWAIAEKILTLGRLGRHEEVRAEMARLKTMQVQSGPAAVVAEMLEPTTAR
jgi:hypothetical protein